MTPLIEILYKYLNPSNLEVISNENITDKIIDELAKQKFNNIYVKETREESRLKNVKIGVMTFPKKITHFFKNVFNNFKGMLGLSPTTHYLYGEKLKGKVEEIKLFVKVKELIENNPELDESWNDFVSHSSYRNQIVKNHSDQIEKDIPRSYVGNEPAGMDRTSYEEKLRKLLYFGVTQVSIDIGYCQGMDSLADAAIRLYPNDNKMAAKFYCSMLHKGRPTRFTEDGLSKISQQVNDKFKKIYKEINLSEEDTSWTNFGIIPLVLTYLINPKEPNQEIALKMGILLFTKGEDGFWNLIDTLLLKFKEDNPDLNQNNFRDPEFMGAQFNPAFTRNIILHCLNIELKKYNIPNPNVLD